MSVVSSAVAALDAHRGVAEVAEMGLCLVRDLATASCFQVECAEVGVVWPRSQCDVSESSVWSCGVFTSAFALVGHSISLASGFGVCECAWVCVFFFRVMGPWLRSACSEC